MDTPPYPAVDTRPNCNSRDVSILIHWMGFDGELHDVPIHSRQWLPVRFTLNARPAAPCPIGPARRVFRGTIQNSTARWPRSETTVLSLVIVPSG